MNRFSISGAFAKGFGFFSGSGAKHALVLIGMGVVTPLALQILVAGGPTGMMSPTMLGEAARQGSLPITAIGLILIVGLGSYALQMGSYFASWRLGLDPGQSASGAIGFGLVAGLLVLLMIVAMGALIGLSAAAAGGTAGAGIALLLGIPLMLLFAAFYTTIASGVVIGMLFMLLIFAALGSSLARAYPGLGLVGGGGAVLLVVFLLMLLFFWITVRLSCTATIMAKRRTFSPFAGIAESWRITGPAQWRIMGFLALIGVLLCVGFFIAAVVAGVSMMGSFQPGGPPPQQQQLWTAQIIAGLVVGIPFAYLTVLVPAGIYRELTPYVPEHEVFA
jgi:hypothetical protein